MSTITKISRDATLTENEREVLIFAVQGLTDESIARRMSLSKRTIENRMVSIRQKLGAGSRANLGYLACFYFQAEESK